MSTYRSSLLLIALLMFALPAQSQEKQESNHANMEISGSQGPILWESLLRGEGFMGWKIEGAPWTSTAWSREGNTLIANVGKTNRARLIQGDSSWRSYEVRVQATLVKGGSFQIWFAVNEGEGYHFATLNGWQTAALVEPDYTKLDVANFVWEYGREYDVVLAVRGKSIMTFIDGQLINRLTLDKRPQGAIGLAVWGKGTIARFRDPQVRHYYRKK